MIRISVISEIEQDRSAICTLLSLQHDFQITGGGRTGYDALKSAADLQPDIIIMDMVMTDISGTELAPIIRRKSPVTKFIALSSCAEDSGINQALKAGITGFLLKQADMDKLNAAVRTVLCGGYYFSAPVENRIWTIHSGTKNIFDTPQTVYQQAESALSNISKTERNIISHLAHGYSDKEIADDLHIAAGTVRNSLASVRRRTGLRNRLQVVVYATSRGFVN